MIRGVIIKSLIVSLMLLSGTAHANLTIAVIGKTKNDSFYEQAYAGCQQFARQAGDLTCLYDGPEDYQNPRSQALIAQHMLLKGVDGLLISTTNSDFLVERVLKQAKQQAVPVITFDSDLLPRHHAYRMAYVGTNNFDFGLALGGYIKRFRKPEGNMLCIQSGSDATPNLNERIRGVRYALSGGLSSRRLTGENGWAEHPRCPFYTLGKRDTALRQLSFILSRNNPPIFLAVAGFAQFSPDYIDQMMPFRQQIIDGELVVVSADAEAIQMKALQQQLSTANISQRPFEMGHYSAELMYRYLKQGRKPAQEINYLGYDYCTPDKGCQATQ